MNDVKFREIVGIAIGEASMCWSEVPKGVFDSTKGSKLVDRICAAAHEMKPSRRQELEAMIMGYHEKIRPLLDEWHRIYSLESRTEDK